MCVKIVSLIHDDHFPRVMNSINGNESSYMIYTYISKTSSEARGVPQQAC